MDRQSNSVDPRRQAEQALLDRAQAVQTHMEVIAALRSLAAAYERAGRRADAHWPREAAAVIEMAQAIVHDLARSLRRRIAGEPAERRLVAEAIALAGADCVDDNDDLLATLNGLAAQSPFDGPTSHAQWAGNAAEIIGEVHQLIRDLEETLVSPVLV